MILDDDFRTLRENARARTTTDWDVDIITAAQDEIHRLRLDRDLWRSEAADRGVLAAEVEAYQAEIERLRTEHERIMRDILRDWAEDRAEVARLRAKQTEMNRRLTKAEAHVETTIEDCRRQGVSVGRGLANAGYMAMRARAEKAEAEVAAFKEWKSESVWVAEVQRIKAERDALRVEFESERIARERMQRALFRVKALRVYSNDADGLGRPYIYEDELDAALRGDA